MEQGILAGETIKEMVERGRIKITPYDPGRVNPASYDLTLGSRVAVYGDVTHADFSCPGKSPAPGCLVAPRGGVGRHLDAAQKNHVIEYEMDERGLILMPSVGYLMHTSERVLTESFVPIIDGKSSIGRLFAYCHVTAGYGDPGFDGQYTLEVVVVHPLRVYPGMRFCQMRFHTMVGEAVSYQTTGSYRGELARGPIPSQSYKMFPLKGA